MKSALPLLLIPLVYLAAVADTSLADRLQVGRVAPDLLALTAVLWVLIAGRQWSFLVAGAIGLVGDLIAPGRVGLGMACFLLAGYALVRLRGRLPLDGLAGQVAAVLVTVALLSAAMATGRWLLGEATEPLPSLLARAAGVGLYTAGVALPLLMVIGWIREPMLARRKKLVDF